MIGDEGAIETYEDGKEPFNVTIDMRRHLVRRRATFGRTPVMPKRSITLYRHPVWYDTAIFLNKRQGQITCGADKNYYPDVRNSIFSLYSSEFVEERIDERLPAKVQINNFRLLLNWKWCVYSREMNERHFLSKRLHLIRIMKSEK